MPDLYRDEEAAAFVDQFGAAGEDVALRVYTSRLLGRDPSLVLHGGGNTSVKTTKRDPTGVELEVLCVKGSGADLKDVEPWGLPAVELQPLLRLRELDSLTDETMVAELRRRASVLEQAGEQLLEGIPRYAPEQEKWPGWEKLRRPLAKHCAQNREQRFPYGFAFPRMGPGTVFCA